MRILPKCADPISLDIRDLCLDYAGHLKYVNDLLANILAGTTGDTRIYDVRVDGRLESAFRELCEEHEARLNALRNTGDYICRLHIRFKAPDTKKTLGFADVKDAFLFPDYIKVFGIDGLCGLEDEFGTTFTVQINAKNLDRACSDILSVVFMPTDIRIEEKTLREAYEDNHNYPPKCMIMMENDHP